MKAVLLHGTDGSSESNWILWLKQQLEKHNFEVYAPSLPNSAFPNGEEWSNFIIQNTPFKLDADTIIVGHSAGAALIPMLLQKMPAETKVKRAILVSGFHTNLGWEKLNGLQNVSVNYDEIKQRCDDFILVHSDNDPYVSMEEPQELAKRLNGKLTVIKGQGHFNLGASPKYKEFPKLLSIILKDNALQNLYLASSFRGAGVARLIMDDIEKLLGKPASEIRLSYITTAGNLHPADKREWIDEGRKILQERGWQVFDYDIADKTEPEVTAELADKDVIFVQGGSCLYMLEQIQKCNFAETIKRLLARGVPYIGESTGSIIAGEDISAYKYWSEDRRENPPELENYNGMGLVDFLIRPHWNHPEKREKYLRMTMENLEKLFEISQPIICLNDNQLIRAEGDSFQIWQGKSS